MGSSVELAFAYLRERLALEADAPEDWAMLADALQDHGDPRGERIHLELRMADPTLTGAPRAAAVRRLAELRQGEQPPSRSSTFGFSTTIASGTDLTVEELVQRVADPSHQLATALIVGERFSDELDAVRAWDDRLFASGILPHFRALKLATKFPERVLAYAQLPHLLHVGLPGPEPLAPVARALAVAPWRPRALTVQGPLDVQVLADLLAGPAFASIQRLGLPGLGHRAQRLPVDALLERLPELHTLELIGPPHRIADLAPLIEGLPRLERLKTSVAAHSADATEGRPEPHAPRLELDTAIATSGGLARLCRQRWWPVVSAWTIRVESDLGRPEIDRLREMRPFTHLERLEVMQLSRSRAPFELASGTLTALLDAAPRLRSLAVRRVAVGEVARSPRIGQLSSLTLTGPWLPEDARAFAETPADLGMLDELVLSATWSDDAMTALVARDDLRPTTLVLNRSTLSDAALIALASSPVASRLTRLELAGDFISDRGVRALAESPHLTGLRELSLFGVSEITEAATQALADAPWGNLTELWVSGRYLHARPSSGATRHALAQRGVQFGPQGT